MLIVTVSPPVSPKVAAAILMIQKVSVTAGTLVANSSEVSACDFMLSLVCEREGSSCQNAHSIGMLLIGGTPYKLVISKLQASHHDAVVLPFDSANALDRVDISLRRSQCYH